MTRLERFFEDFSETITNPKERADYDQGIEKILEDIDLQRIPRKLIWNTPYPEYFPLFGTQATEKTCGCNSMKAWLMISYGKPYTEQKIWNKSRDPEKIKEKGIGPAEIARILKTIGKRRFRQKLKVFATNYGDIGQLNYFLERKQFPIINRPWYEPGTKADNHFELVFAIDEKNVYLHNPWPEEPDSGLHRLNRDKFRKWWDLKYGDEHFRWYLAPIPAEQKVPKYFGGRFL